MAERCPISVNCKYAGTPECLISRHHVYFPSSDYKTRIEREFRELPENKFPVSRCDHDTLHELIGPPQKPNRSEMVAAIAQSAINRLERAS